MPLSDVPHFLHYTIAIIRQLFVFNLRQHLLVNRDVTSRFRFLVATGATKLTVSGDLGARDKGQRPVIVTCRCRSPTSSSSGSGCVRLGVLFAGGRRRDRHRVIGDAATRGCERGLEAFVGEGVKKRVNGAVDVAENGEEQEKIDLPRLYGAYSG